MIRFQSWNVNGFRSIRKKEEWAWFECENSADIVGIQETKAHEEQIPAEDKSPLKRKSYWANSLVRKGYSGVAVFTNLQPLKVEIELPDPAYQGEGRIVHLEFPHFHYFNGYFPNGGEELSKGVFKRVPYKMGFFESFLAYAELCRKEKPIVVCGDFNIAHKEIDLARPKDNIHNTGFLEEERAFLDKMTASGYVDTFRHVHGDTDGAYTWWSYKTRARERNIGWRIDYFFVSEELKPFISNAWIEDTVYGSDHCPIGLSLDLPSE